MFAFLFTWFHNYQAIKIPSTSDVVIQFIILAFSIKGENILTSYLPYSRVRCSSSLLGLYGRSNLILVKNGWPLRKTEIELFPLVSSNLSVEWKELSVVSKPTLFTFKGFLNEYMSSSGKSSYTHLLIPDSCQKGL